MSLPDISLPLLTLVSVIASFVIVKWQLYKTTQEVEQIRKNDMHDLETRLTRIEDKLDSHLQFHMTNV